jgi:hypothetical protein
VRERLAEQDAAGLAHAPDGGRVAAGDVIGEDRGAVRGPQTGRVEDVLDGDRETGQRPRAAARILTLGGCGLGPRLVQRERDERVDIRLALRDARRQRVDYLDGAEAPRLVAGTELQRGGGAEIAQTRTRVMTMVSLMRGFFVEKCRLCMKKYE